MVERCNVENFYVEFLVVLTLCKNMQSRYGQVNMIFWKHFCTTTWCTTLKQWALCLSKKKKYSVAFKTRSCLIAENKPPSINLPTFIFSTRNRISGASEKTIFSMSRDLEKCYILNLKSSSQWIDAIKTTKPKQQYKYLYNNVSLKLIQIYLVLLYI